MSENHVVKISVRNLVEFVMRSGNLISSFKGASRNIDAIKAHQKIQNKGGKEYNKEYYLCYKSSMDNIEIEVSGRADGVIIKEKEVIIDEIKTTLLPIEEIYEDMNPMHWAQAKSYAFIYAEENNLNFIKVQLTYYTFDKGETKKFIKEFSIEELRNFFYDLLEQYITYARIIKEWYILRNDSIKSLNFPFQNYREGQREFAVAVYRTMEKGKKLFAEAPTGIGKTMAALFPSIKGMGQGLCSKIFYLTAKTINRRAVEKAFDNMINIGLRSKVVVLTAKEKICFKDKNCDPEVCPYANGHYDRINEAVRDIFQREDIFTEDIIKEYAEKHNVCPFEFSLDLCNWADCVVCDYNYVFDPRVYLRRFFDSYDDYVILVDEAHNLPDRVREMYSAELNKKAILSLRKAVKDKLPELYKNLGKINTFFLNEKKKMQEDTFVQKEPPEDIYGLLRKFIVISDKWLSKEENADFKEELLEKYFDILRFCKTYEVYSEKYTTYFNKDRDDVTLKLFCLDPSDFVENILHKVKATIFFSATLTPINYFMDMLCKEKECFKIRLKSPFPKENMCLIIDNKISTKYKDREFTYDFVVKDIWEVIRKKKGNYMVFSPSYKYMNIIHDKFKEYKEDFRIHTIKQELNMDDNKKQEFLNSFSEDNSTTLVGFAVIGGMFGEGIDLTGDKLIGVIVIGVGMPQICIERNLIKEYYDEKNAKGFEYSYVYPGMNKVMQAVGRVIRTEEDRGTIVLIDNRFNNYIYKKLMPPHWNPILKGVKGINLDHVLSNFWEE